MLFCSKGIGGYRCSLQFPSIYLLVVEGESIDLVSPRARYRARGEAIYSAAEQKNGS